MTIYRCSRCRKQIEMESGHGGELCPVCETPGSHLQVVQKVSGASVDRSLTSAYPADVRKVAEGFREAREEARERARHRT